jgi:hypothetical protein
MFPILCFLYNYPNSINTAAAYTHRHMLKAHLEDEPGALQLR